MAKCPVRVSSKVSMAPDTKAHSHLTKSTGRARSPSKTESLMKASSLQGHPTGRGSSRMLMGRRTMVTSKKVSGPDGACSQLRMEVYLRASSLTIR